MKPLMPAASRVFVAGAIGPLNRTLSISRDVNDPGKRDVTFEQVAAAYRRSKRAFGRRRVDILLVETIFDTLNAKAALVRDLRITLIRTGDVFR